MSTSIKRVPHKDDIFNEHDESNEITSAVAAVRRLELMAEASRSAAQDMVIEVRRAYELLPEVDEYGWKSCVYNIWDAARDLDKSIDNIRKRANRGKTMRWVNKNRETVNIKKDLKFGKLFA